MTSPRLGIAIDLDQLRGLMREFIDDRKQHGEQTETELTFELFLQWVRRREQQPADSNLLTFRVEKEGADGKVS